MPNNELQELLGARFKEHTHPTNEAVWNAIEAQLDAEQKDRVGIWFWIFNGLAATLLIGMMFQMTNDSTITNESNELQLSENTQEEITSVEVKESIETKPDPQSGIVESNKSPLNAESSSFSQDGITNNSRNLSSKTSLNKLTLQPIEQTLILPDVSTHDDGGFVVTTHAGPKYREYTIDTLNIRPLNNPNEVVSLAEIGPNVAMSKKMKNHLPIHLGCEFTYVRRQRVAADAIGIYSDSSYTPYNDELAYNRHFEISLFSQFDFTRRFSASIGFGYSHSKYSADDPTASLSINGAPQKSELNLFTVPIQTKFNFLQKKRITLGAGLTFQSEFGRIDHLEAEPEEIWTSTGTSSLNGESLVVNRINIRQFAFEPYLQFSVNITPRISCFTNLGYKLYMKQKDINLTPIGRLNYFNADLGLCFRLK